MKLHKMGGPIKEFRVEHIEEIRAVCEYNAALRRGLSPESPDLIQALHPVLYAQTPLLQAGYQIASIKIAGGQKVPLLQAISNMAGRTWKGEKKTKVDPAKLQHYEEVARHYGFDPTIGSEVILFGFHVDMKLTPPIPR